MGMRTQKLKKVISEAAEKVFLIFSTKYNSHILIEVASFPFRNLIAR